MTKLTCARAAGVLTCAAALLAIPSASAAAPTATSGRVSANSRLTTDQATLRGHDVPGLAVDPGDPNHVVMIEENFLTGQCDFHASFDAGKTWSAGHLTVPSDFADPPCRTFDSGGYAHYNQSVVFGSGQNVYTTFASHRGAQQRPESKVVQGEGDSVIVSHSADGGKTFQTGVVAIQGSPQSQPYVIRPGVAVQARPGGDRVYAIGWSLVVTSGGALSGGGDRKVVTSVSNDGGATWAAPVEAQGPTEHMREPSPPVVGPDGAVYFAWRNRDDPATAPHPVVVARSSDGGATWSRTAVADMLAPANAKGSSGHPRLAVDMKSNTLYVVYQNYTLGGPLGSDNDIFIQRSTDDAATWSAPVRVNDDPKANGVAQIAARVSVAPNGRVDVVWLDARNAYPTPAALKAKPQAEIFWASSTDKGQTFSANRRISDHSINQDTGLGPRVGDYSFYAPTLAPLGDNAILFAWADPRLGNVDTDNSDIETATLNLTAGGPPEIQQLPTTDIAAESVAVSQLSYPGGAERIGGGATSKAVIVNKADTTSALPAAVLARANFGALLLAPSSGLTKQLRDEVTRLRPSSVYLVGSASSLSPQFEKDLGAAGVHDVTRLSAPTPDGIAKAVALALDVRPPADASKPPADPSKPPADNGTGADGAVVVNPAAPEAPAAAALGAALRYPVLFSGRDAIPATTTDAIAALAVPTVLVVGDPASISDAVVGRLPSAKRIGGPDTVAISAAVATEESARGVPSNIVFVADAARSDDAVMAGVAAARAGGLVLLRPGAKAGNVAKAVAALQLPGPVDQIVLVRSTSPAAGLNVIVVVVSGVLALLGIILLGCAVAARRRHPAPAGAPSPGTPIGAT